MMHIEQQPQGWTIVNDEGNVMLVDAERRPLYCGTYETVANICHQQGYYEVHKNNPGGYPAGTLVTLEMKK
jgi:hypothetical protein